jgi:hypothetical protein
MDTCTRCTCHLRINCAPSHACHHHGEYAYMCDWQTCPHYTCSGFLYHGTNLLLPKVEYPVHGCSFNHARLTSPLDPAFGSHAQNCSHYSAKSVQTTNKPKIVSFHPWTFTHSFTSVKNQSYKEISRHFYFPNPSPSPLSSPNGATGRLMPIPAITFRYKPGYGTICLPICSPSRNKPANVRSGR